METGQIPKDLRYKQWRTALMTRDIHNQMKQITFVSPGMFCHLVKFDALAAWRQNVRKGTFVARFVTVSNLMH